MQNIVSSLTFLAALTQYKNNANHKEKIDKNNTHMRLWTAVVTSESFHKILNCVKAARKVRDDSMFCIR